MNIILDYCKNQNKEKIKAFIFNKRLPFATAKRQLEIAFEFSSLSLNDIRLSYFILHQFLILMENNNKLIKENFKIINNVLKVWSKYGLEKYINKIPDLEKIINESIEKNKVNNGLLVNCRIGDNKKIIEKINNENNIKSHEKYLSLCEVINTGNIESIYCFNDFIKNNQYYFWENSGHIRAFISFCSLYVREEPINKIKCEQMFVFFVDNFYDAHASMVINELNYLKKLYVHDYDYQDDARDRMIYIDKLLDLVKLNKKVLDKEENDIKYSKINKI